MTRCACKTAKGKRCSRNAKEKSEYCYQHVECKNPIMSKAKKSKSKKVKNPKKFKPPSTKSIVLTAIHVMGPMSKTYVYKYMYTNYKIDDRKKVYDTLAKLVDDGKLKIIKGKYELKTSAKK